MYGGKLGQAEKFISVLASSEGWKLKLAGNKVCHWKREKLCNVFIEFSPRLPHSRVPLTGQNDICNTYALFVSICIFYASSMLVS